MGTRTAVGEFGSEDFDESFRRITEELDATRIFLGERAVKGGRNTDAVNHVGARLGSGLFDRFPHFVDSIMPQLDIPQRRN